MRYVEGRDYYIDPDTGSLVWTTEALLARGYCCNHRCRHCPYVRSAAQSLTVLSSSSGDAARHPLGSTRTP